MTLLRDLPDKELIRKWREDHDERAFTTLVNRYRPRILTYMTKQTGDRDEAEDLTQEVLIRIWTALEDYEDISFGGWVHVLSRNVLIDFKRSTKADPTVPFAMLADEDGHIPVEGVDLLTPESSMLASELGRLILEKLGKLPKEHREVMLARYQDGFLIREIAEMFAVPENTVKTWLFRGRQELLKQMDPWLT